VNVKPARNDPCPCGSGKKLKHCCGQIGSAAPSAPAAQPQAEAITALEKSQLVGMIGAGRYAEMESKTRELIHRHPNSGFAWKALGVSLTMQHKDALQALQTATQLLPEDAEAHANLAVTLLELGRLEDAVISYQRALQIKPDYADAHINLGNALRSLGQLDEALASYRRALAIKPEYAEAHRNLGNALLQAGRVDEAVVSYRRALAIKPDFADAHNDLGNALLALGRLDEAVASYRQTLDLKPDYAEVHNNLGNALRGLGLFDEAMANCRRALQSKPDLAEAHNNLGNILLEVGQLDEALDSYRRALALKPEFADAHSNLGIALRLQGRTAEAEASCLRALAFNPAQAETLAVLADAHADRGQFAQAEALFRRAIAREPDLPHAWAGMAHLRTMTSDDVSWLAQAQRIASKNLPPRSEVILRYAIGKYFDDVKDYDQAFLNYQRANEISARHGIKHDQIGLTHYIDRLIQSYDRKWVGHARTFGVRSARPVFIVGMPRSGTSLAEQILAAHPSVFGAGELTYWNSASARYQLAAGHGGVNGGALRSCADDYLQLLQSLSPDALRVVDKMPANFLHLGLIHAALPQACIVHMRRDPIDTCLSIYFQDFKSVLSYASDLQDLAHYYGQYLRVMKHWQMILPENVILDMSYEDLVADPETWSRTMLEFIALPWHPSCLDFQHASRTVVTASKWQVRQPISNASVGRWRHYEKHVAALHALSTAR